MFRATLKLNIPNSILSSFISVEANSLGELCDAVAVRKGDLANTHPTSTVTLVDVVTCSRASPWEIEKVAEVLK